MVGFTKLSSSIVTSTVWQESSDTRVVWITLLALADADGRVDATIPGLANIANVSVEATRTALGIFLSPDEDSRTKDFEGRRIEAMDGGWLLLNHAKHRAQRDPEIRRQQNREAKQRQRQKSASSQQCQPSQPKSAHTEAEADTEAEKKLPCANEQRFARFWEVWPKHVKKVDAKKVWKKIKPSQELTKTIVASVVAQKTTTQWLKNSGQYIPGPGVWLRAESWDDDIAAMNYGAEEPKPTTQGYTPPPANVGSDGKTAGQRLRERIEKQRNDS